jgi:hypothetical protein
VGDESNNRKEVGATGKVGNFNRKKGYNNDSVALVRERTIPTERPPLVGEVSANFCG